MRTPGIPRVLRTRVGAIRCAIVPLPCGWPRERSARATNGREGAVRQAPREDSPSVQRWIGWGPFGRGTRSEKSRPVRSDPGLRSDRFCFQHLGTFGGHFLAAAGAAGRGGGGGGAGRGGGGAGRAIWGAGRGSGGGRGRAARSAPAVAYAARRIPARARY